MSSDTLFWELTYKSVEKSINKKEDVLLVFIHWALLKSGLRCVGLKVTEAKVEDGRELLPDDWNKNESYSLTYISKSGELYSLGGTVANGYLVIELINLKKMSISALSLAIDHVQECGSTKPLSSMIFDHQGIFRKIKTELIDKVFNPDNIRDEETQTLDFRPDNRNLPPRNNRGIPDFEDNFYIDSQPDFRRDIENVGRSDLDPIGRSGVGGMIFPFGPNRPPLFDPGSGIPGGLPRGAVPPGARFDPFGPPGAGSRGRPRRFPPDSDHMPPPGYDDMFM
uniref:Proteasome inhibitor PI31 subunit n=1 Tax=Clastoptera arizonana TaxID=38151 RepID=A0A1B6D1P0_9HEMI